MASKKKDSKVPLDIKLEITAMGWAYEALRGLDDEAQRRAMRWLDERLTADRHARNQASRPDYDDYDDEVPF